MCCYIYKCSSYLCVGMYINVGLFERKYTFCCAAASAEKECGRQDPPGKRNDKIMAEKIQILIALESRMCYSNFMSLCTMCIWAVFYCGVLTLTTYICCACSFKTYTFCVYFLTAYIFCAYFFDTYIRSQLGWPVANRLPSVKSTPYYKYVCTCKLCIFYICYI